MGRNSLTVVVAVSAALCVGLGQAQDSAWDESISLARRAVAAKQFDRAARLLGQARRAAQGFAQDDPRRAVPLMELAKLHLSRGDYAVPEQLYREADEIGRRAWGAESREYASLLDQIGRYYHLRVKHREAERFYMQAFAIRTRLLGRKHPDVAAVLNNLAVLYENQVHYARAEAYYRTALDIRQASLGEGHPDTLMSLDHLARLLYKLSRPADAAEFERRARAQRQAQATPVNPADLGPLATGAGVQPAVLIERTEPDYTDEARRANHEGSVLLQVDVNAEGMPVNILVLRHLGLGLDRRAIEAVRQWRFRPARSAGRKVPSRLRLEIAFRLI